MNNYNNLKTVSCSVSLSSCRLKAEAIARALNNRIWPNTLLNDFDVPSDEEIPQVTSELNNARCSKSDITISRAPQAHNIYNAQQKIIGHCYVNGTDEDDEYFDTPDCSPLPSPIEDEVIVNPPIHNGVPPFYTGPHYDQIEEGISSELSLRNEDKIDGAKLYEKLQKYSDSLQQNEDLLETFYDISDEEENVRKADCTSDSMICVSDTENIKTLWTETPKPSPEDKNSSGDTEYVQNFVTNSSCNGISLHNSEVVPAESEGLCRQSVDTDNSTVTMGKNLDENSHSENDPVEHNYSENNPTESTGNENLNESNDESIPSYPSIGVQPASPSASDWTPLEAESSSIPSRPDNRQLDANFRIRRLQELEEEERPKLIRSTSLKTGKTPPGTPCRKKYVRFADALGLDLEDVRHIITDDLPHVPSSAFTDLNLTEDEVPPAPSAVPYRVADRTPFNVSSTSNTWESLQGVGSGAYSLYPLFTLASNMPGFLDKVRIQGVCLENIIVSDLSLHCICRVYNFSFSKCVTARYTTNEWKSCEEVTASYVPDSSDGHFDKFSFSMFLPHMQPNGRLQFAIRYVVNGGVFWDNNNGENYILRCHDNTPALPSSEESSSWIHHFY